MVGLNFALLLSLSLSLSLSFVVLNLLCVFIFTISLGVDEADGGILWPSLHPDGVPCASCPTCMQFPVLAKLFAISNHLELIKVAPHLVGEKKRFAENFALAGT